MLLEVWINCGMKHKCEPILRSEKGWDFKGTCSCSLSSSYSSWAVWSQWPTPRTTSTTSSGSTNPSSTPTSSPHSRLRKAEWHFSLVRLQNLSKHIITNVFLSSLLNLTLKVFNLNNKSVSWVRAKDNHILTVDRETFISGKTENINTQNFCNSSKSSIFFPLQTRDSHQYTEGRKCQIRWHWLFRLSLIFGLVRGRRIGNTLFSIFSRKTRKVTKTKSDKIHLENVLHIWFEGRSKPDEID